MKKNYAPYLMYQIARFGGLTVPQMERICVGKCKRSLIYRFLGSLVDDGLAYPVLNPSSGTRAYYATVEGRHGVLGKDVQLVSGMKPNELDHTILCTDVLLRLCHFKNVTGITGTFELSPSDIRVFSLERTPDGVFQVTQGGQAFEIALEIESSVRNMERINHLLENYNKVFQLGMPCKGLLIVATDSTIFGMYTRAIEKMPEEFKSHVRLIRGHGLNDLACNGYGVPLQAAAPRWDLSRTLFTGEVVYSPVKSQLLLAQTTLKNPEKPTVGQQFPASDVFLDV